MYLKLNWQNKRSGIYIKKNLQRQAGAGVGRVLDTSSKYMKPRVGQTVCTCVCPIVLALRTWRQEYSAQTQHQENQEFFSTVSLRPSWATRDSVPPSEGKRNIQKSWETCFGYFLWSHWLECWRKLKSAICLRSCMLLISSLPRWNTPQIIS